MGSHQGDVKSERLRPLMARSYSLDGMPRRSSRRNFISSRGVRPYTRCRKLQQRRESCLELRPIFCSTKARRNLQHSFGSEGVLTARQSKRDSKKINNISAMLHKRLTINEEQPQENMSKDFSNPLNINKHLLDCKSGENHHLFAGTQIPWKNDMDDVSASDTTGRRHFGDCLENLPLNDGNKKPDFEDELSQIRQGCCSSTEITLADDVNDNSHSFSGCFDNTSGFYNISKPPLGCTLSRSCPEYSINCRLPLLPFKSSRQSKAAVVGLYSHEEKESGLLESRHTKLVTANCCTGKPFHKISENETANIIPTAKIIKTDEDCSKEAADNKDINTLEAPFFPEVEPIDMTCHTNSETFTDRDTETNSENENLCSSSLRKQKTVILIQVHHDDDDSDNVYEDDYYPLSLEALQNLLCQKVNSDGSVMEVADENTNEDAQRDRPRSYKNLLTYPSSFQCAVCNSNLEMPSSQCLDEDCKNVIPFFARDDDYTDLHLYCPRCCCQRWASHPY